MTSEDEDYVAHSDGDHSNSMQSGGEDYDDEDGGDDFYYDDEYDDYPVQEFAPPRRPAVDPLSM